MESDNYALFWTEDKKSEGIIFTATRLVTADLSAGEHLQVQRINPLLPILRKLKL